MELEPNKKTSTGLQENVACLLCYLAWWITGLVFFLIEKENKKVRFHAAQSLILGITIMIINVVLSIVSGIIPLIGAPLSGLFGLLTFVAWIYFMITAYQGTTMRVPVVSDKAEEIVSK